MPTLSSNPLAKHFRQPALYIKLPSQGRWYPEGSLDLPVSGEIPIYPMTAKDEITMKTPDALMNGASTMMVIESCCPNIKDAWKMPAVDIDPILIAIRLATYGNSMDFTANCPHCGTENERALDLNFILDKVTVADWSKPVITNNIEIHLKPQTYEDFNKNNIVNFEEQRIMKMIQDENVSDSEKIQNFGELFKKLIATGIEQVSKSIDGIKIEDGTYVTDKEHIREFLENCDRKIWNDIKNHLAEIQNSINYNQITIECENEECKKEFITPFVFEQSNFFD
jgi:hypothetical protein